MNNIIQKAMTSIAEQIEIELKKAISKGMGLTVVYPYGGKMC